MSRGLRAPHSSSAMIRTLHTSAAAHEVFILSAVRTPIGSFGGSLATVPAVDLGGRVISAAVERAGVPRKAVDSVLFGNVLQGGVGQAPARQAALKGGLLESTCVTTVNKVCASGLKSVSLAAQEIRLGDSGVVVAGGMESMSQSPYYLKRNLSFGHSQVLDAIVNDGLTDPHHKIHMGLCCENTVKRENISREEQDEYAIESYRRARESIERGLFRDEIVPVEVKTRKGLLAVTEDEAVAAVKLEKIPALRPAFDRAGTVTAANASSINDGAAALVLAAADRAAELGARPLARVVAYADAATAPIDFTIAPALAIPRVLAKAGLRAEDVALWEINEAFAGVSIANNRRLNLDAARVNVRGGAVALGHPIGASGARILVTLVHALAAGQYGVAAICNGGGGATAVVVERL